MMLAKIDAELFLFVLLYHANYVIFIGFEKRKNKNAIA